MTTSPISTLVLASASPRRRDLLADLGVTYDVRAADLDETLLPDEKPLTAARRLALAKAKAVAGPALTVIGADTIVVLDGAPLGKPVDAEEARAMLLRLRNRPHEVVTGVAVVVDGVRSYQGHATTGVVMRPYTDWDIDAYIERGEPYDKAGGYAIQDSTFKPVRMWNGCYCNIVGLPLALTGRLLVQAGYPLQPVTKPKQCEGCIAWDRR